MAWVSWCPGVAPAAEPLLMPGKKTLYHPIDNAGHSAGREITPEQNLRLGEILKMRRGEHSPVSA